jgi:hypothetical protein
MPYTSNILSKLRPYFGAILVIDALLLDSSLDILLTTLTKFAVLCYSCTNFIKQVYFSTNVWLI